MVTYIQVIGGTIYRYWYDREIRLWTIQQIDEAGNQVTDECDYVHNREQLLEQYPFRFEKDDGEKFAA